MAKNDFYSQIKVCLPEKQYPILICQNGLTDPDLLRRLVVSNQVMIVSNTSIAPLYLQPVKAAFAAIQCDVLILEDGEAYKNQASLDRIYQALISNRHHRDTCLIALGGGVVGDITGFAAATYQRGVRFVQIPTTLLAQIDASVGGKTAINHPQGKNLIGSFYQPDAVLIDTLTLATLPQREFRAGLAEMIKYGLLVGGTFLEQLEDLLAKGLEPTSTQLPELIKECCKIKACYVEADEKEAGKRALLNLGHTFGHALEAYTHYEKWLHGEAVAIGLYCAALLSVELGLAQDSLVSQLIAMLELAGLAYTIPATVDLDGLLDLMRLDKKIKSNSLRFVVIREPGDCYLDDKVTESCLRSTLIKAVEGE